MRIELIISSLQDWCLTTMALEALSIFKKGGYTAAGNRTQVYCLVGSHSTTEPRPQKVIFRLL